MTREIEHPREGSATTRAGDSAPTLGDPRFAHLSPGEIIREEIRTERMELIPVGQIVLEGFLVDTDHSLRLEESMSGSRGQISPITVRARMGGNSVIYYDVVDGFHRSLALKNMKIGQAKAIVIYGCSEEELYDLRVLAANSVRSVQFARIAQWMQGSFAESPWGQKGLTLAQAFSLVVFDTAGNRLGLTEEEAEGIKKWVREKARKWNKQVATIWDDMIAVEVAAEDLVSRVRIGGGGSHSRKGELSPSRLKAVVKALPHQHELQRQVIDVVTAHNLVSKKAHLLAKAVARHKEDPEAIQEILADPLLTIEIMEDEEMASKPKQTKVDEETGERSYGRFHEPSTPPIAIAIDWGEVSELTVKERIALRMIFEEGVDFETAASKLTLLPINYYN